MGKLQRLAGKVMLRTIFGMVIAMVVSLSCVAQAPQARSTADTTLSKDWVNVYYGVIVNPARKVLEDAWTDSTRQVERAFCIQSVSYSVQWARTHEGNKLGREVLARVWTVDTAITKGATPTHIADIDCPSNAYLLHTHPPTSCQDDSLPTCVYGGVNAFNCDPSREDYITLVTKKHRFGVLQCGKNQFRFFWPSEYRP